MIRKLLWCRLFGHAWAYTDNGCKVCERCTALTIYPLNQARVRVMITEELDTSSKESPEDTP